jgi:Cd2+/Zn2+-exporting ATPase
VENHPKDKNAPASDHCLLRSVSAAFATDPNLEAITLNKAEQTIAVATIGKAPDAQLTERIQSRIRHTQNGEASPRCQLWEGAANCEACPTPLSPLERTAYRIEHKDGRTTISRVTCPTAPRFWHWRSFPWPRVVQRDVEFLEHAEQVDEWKPQLLAAILCGVFGLAGFFLGSERAGLICYLLAYVAGGWYTVEEVWERLRQRSIDVHFLMLAVAAGSASIGAWGEGAMLLFLFSLSGALEHFALGRTQREIRALFPKDAPKVATLLDENGHQRDIPVEQLRRACGC